MRSLAAPIATRRPSTSLRVFRRGRKLTLNLIDRNFIGRRFHFNVCCGDVRAQRRLRRIFSTFDLVAFPSFPPSIGI